MTERFGMRWFVVTVASALGGALLLAGVRSAVAIEQPTEAQIVDALKAKRLTRCPHASAISGCGGAPLAPPEEKPSINVEIPFGYASAVLGPTAKSILSILGEALGKPEFIGVAFLIYGYTDARGSTKYNQRLSQRRAEAVKGLLVQQFNLPATTLIAVGYGKTQLKNAAEPFARENRRVQIMNTEVNSRCCEPKMGSSPIK